MKIAFFSQNIGNYIGGGRLYSWHIAHILAYKGHEVNIFTGVIPLFDREYENFPGRQNIKIHVDNYYGSKNKDRLNIMKSCDLFFCSPMESLDYGITLAKMYNKKVISILFEPVNMMVEAVENGIEIPWDTEIEKMHSDFAKQIHKSDMILCNTKYTLEMTKQWLPVFKGKLEYVYNSFNTVHANKVENVPIDKREYAIAFISRMQLYKGFGDLPYIFGQTTKKPKIYFISGFIDKMSPVHNKFFKMCKDDLKLDFEICNRIDELEKFKILSRCRALYFPSRFEGFGLPPAEAFYVKTPVICYDLPVLKEIYGDFAHFISSFDIDQSLSFFKNEFNDDKILFKDIEKASDYVKSFVDLDIFANKIENCVNIVLNRKIEIKQEIKIQNKIEKKIEKTFEISKEIGILVIGKASQGLLDSLKYQTCKHSNIYDNVEFDKIKEENLLICNGDLILNEKCLEEVSVRLIEGNDFVFGNYKIQDKKANLPDFSIDLFLMDPSYISNVIGCKKSIVKDYKLSNVDWEMNLVVDFCKNKWINCKRILYYIEEEPCYQDITCFNKIMKSEKINNDWNHKIMDGCIRWGYFPKEFEKTLLMISARTNNYLPTLYKSILENDIKNMEIIVIHHHPEGKWETDVVEFCRDKNLKLTKVDGEFNFSKMNNIAFDKFIKDSKYVILLNDDIKLKGNAIRSILGGFNYKWEKVGIIGAKLLFPNKNTLDASYFENNWNKYYAKIQHAGVVFVKDYLTMHSNKHSGSNKLSVNYFKEVESVTFAFVAIDRKCYEEIRLDLEFGNDFNDNDFCLRAKEKGWKTIYNPHAVAFHMEAVTRKQYVGKTDPKGNKLFREKYGTMIEKGISYQELKDIEMLGG